MRIYVRGWMIALLGIAVVAGCGTPVDEISSPGSLLALTPPTVSAGTPASGAANVRIDTTISAVFSKPMDSATINDATFLVTETLSSAPVYGTVIYFGGTVAYFYPFFNLTNGLSYTVTMEPGATDLNGNLLARTSWTFTITSDVTGPIVLSTTPADAAIDVAVDTTVTVVFDENIDCATATASAITLTDPALTSVGGTITSCSGTTFVFTPSAALNNNETYTVTIVGGVIEDVYGNPTAGTTTTFTTIP